MNLSDQAKIVIDKARKSLKKKLEHNELGDTTFSFSEEEKKEMVEDAKLAQNNFHREEKRMLNKGEKMKDKIKYIRIKFLAISIWGIGWGLIMGGITTWWVGCLFGIGMWFIAMVVWKTYETDFGEKEFGWRNKKLNTQAKKEVK